MRTFIILQKTPEYEIPVQLFLDMSITDSIMSMNPPIKRKYGRIRDQMLIVTKSISGPLKPAIMTSMTPRMNKLIVGIETRPILIT